MPSLETWKQVTNSSEDFDFLSAFTQYRNHHGNGQQEMMFVSNFNDLPRNELNFFRSRITSSLPVPITEDPLKNFTQWIYLSQIDQAMMLKAVSDHCRLHSPIASINPNTSQG